MDYCISTADAHAFIEDIQIKYQFDIVDFIPIGIEIDLGHLQGHMDTGQIMLEKGKLDWAKIDGSLKIKYHSQAEFLLCQVNLDYDAFLGRDFNCTNSGYVGDLCIVYNRIVDCLRAACDYLHKRIGVICVMLELA